MAIHQCKPLRILVLALALLTALCAPLQALAAILEVHSYDDLIRAAAICADDDIIMLMQNVYFCRTADSAVETVAAGNVIVTGDDDNTFVSMDGAGDPGYLLVWDGKDFTVECVKDCDGGETQSPQDAVPDKAKSNGTVGSGNVASLYTAMRRTPIYTDETKAKQIGYLPAGAKVTVRFISSGMACFGNGYVAYSDLKHTP